MSADLFEKQKSLGGLSVNDCAVKTAFAGVRTANAVYTVPPELSLNLLYFEAVLFGRVVSHAPPTESYTTRFLSVHG